MCKASNEWSARAGRKRILNTLCVPGSMWKQYPQDVSSLLRSQTQYYVTSIMIETIFILVRVGGAKNGKNSPFGRCARHRELVMHLRAACEGKLEAVMCLSSPPPLSTFRMQFSSFNIPSRYFRMCQSKSEGKFHFEGGGGNKHKLEIFFLIFRAKKRLENHVKSHSLLASASNFFFGWINFELPCVVVWLEFLNCVWFTAALWEHIRRSTKQF
jgi:hypothetical protein